MAEIEKRRRFIELRGQGISYLRISEELEVTTRTLMNWSKELVNEISNQKALEFELLGEEYMIGRRQQLKVAGSQLGQITEELLKRDLSELPTSKLFDMQRKLTREIADQTKDVVFVEETRTDGLHKLDDMYKKVEKWTG